MLEFIQKIVFFGVFGDIYFARKLFRIESNRSPLEIKEFLNKKIPNEMYLNFTGKENLQFSIDVNSFFYVNIAKSYFFGRITHDTGKAIIEGSFKWGFISKIFILSSTVAIVMKIFATSGALEGLISSLIILHLIQIILFILGRSNYGNEQRVFSFLSSAAES